MFVTVYTIAKNESKHILSFMTSANEADAVIVLDTGSEDNTAELLRSLGATVYEETISPWRFDTARNRSLELIPPETDVCVCFDMDERLTPGWRAALESVWKPGETERAYYRYVWNYNADGSEGVTFNREKIHAPGIFKWTHPVHEVLTRSDGAVSDVSVFIPGVVCEHRADDTKSRSNYLELLELSVKEDPSDDRNAHYLGREYMFRGMWEKAIAALERHLALPTAIWKPERCASMRFLGRCYEALGKYEKASRWFSAACSECPGLREPWFEAERFHYARGRWKRVIEYGISAAAITVRQDSSYIQDADAWGPDAEDMLAIAFRNMGERDKALIFAARALCKRPGDKRLLNNLRVMAGA
jgi:glycosyltransferase involved in cell wall biosynthesis